MSGEAFSGMDKEGGRIGSGVRGSGQGGIGRCVRTGRLTPCHRTAVFSQQTAPGVPAHHLPDPPAEDSSDGIHPGAEP